MGGGGGGGRASGGIATQRSVTQWEVTSAVQLRETILVRRNKATERTMKENGEWLT